MATVLACGDPGARTAARESAVARAHATCGLDSAAALTGSGLGELRIGARAERVHRFCRVLRDTVALGIEGMPERTMRVDLGRALVSATVVDDSVWRLQIDAPSIRTADSLGVGTPVSALRTRPGAQLLTGEGGVFITLPSHCGLSFRVGGAHPAPGLTLKTLSDSARVDRILVVGCSKH